MAANPLSALVTRRSGRLSWRLRGAAEAGATSYRRGSSSRGTPGHYAPGPVTARKLPRRRVGPACEQPSGRLGQFRHAAKRLGRRRFGECRPGACDSIAGIRRGVRVSWRTGCGPAFGARLSVLAVPADVRACLAAIRHQQGSAGAQCRTWRTRRPPAAAAPVARLPADPPPSAEDWPDAAQVSFPVMSSQLMRLVGP